jgi:hypothetical protein
MVRVGFPGVEGDGAEEGGGVMEARRSGQSIIVRARVLSRKGR